MNDLLTQPLEPGRLAEACHLSPGRFLAVAYSRGVRLRRACALLEQTGLSLGGLALQVVLTPGFSCYIRCLQGDRT